MENYNFLFETFFYQLNHKEENSKERPTCNFCIQTCVQQLQEKRETEVTKPYIKQTQPGFTFLSFFHHEITGSWDTLDFKHQKSMNIMKCITSPPQSITLKYIKAERLHLLGC